MSFRKCTWPCVGFGKCATRNLITAASSVKLAAVIRRQEQINYTLDELLLLGMCVISLDNVFDALCRGK